MVDSAPEPPVASPPPKPAAAGRIGLDIGRRAIKLIQVDTGDPPAVVVVGLTATPPGLFRDDAGFAALEPLVDALRRLLSELGVRGGEVATAVDLPELRLRWHPADGEPDDRPDPAAWRSAEVAVGESTRLLAAVECQRIDELCLALEAAGLRPLSIDAAPLAAAEALELCAEALVLDIGADGTSFTRWSQAGPVAARWEPVGGQALTERLAVATARTIDEAERYKLLDLPFTLADPGVERVVDEWVDELIAPARDPSTLAGVEEVVLIGGGARTVGLVERLRLRLDRAVRLGDAFAGRPAEQVPGSIRADGAMYVTAMGLATGPLVGES